MANPEGYSGTPLPKKLGFKPGMTVLLKDPPDNYAALLREADDVAFIQDAAAPVDAVHLFVHAPSDIAAAARVAIADLVSGGMLWVSWAKTSSPLHGGVTEDDLRTHILPLGWVDVKVCAVDKDWSGLKFLKRKAKTTKHG